MANSISVTQTFVGITKEGNRIYNVKAVATGDNTSGAIAIPVTKLSRIIGTPGFTVVQDSVPLEPYLASTAVSGTTVTVTLSANIGNLATVTVVGDVIGY